MEVLDSPVWHALTGPQHTVAERVGDAVRYDPDYSVFAAIAPGSGPGAWDELATLVGAAPALLVPTRTAPKNWTCLGALAVVQMVLDRPPRRRPRAEQVPDPQVLGPSDRDRLGALVAVTEPGPWCARTAELGTFFGIRVGDRLVAAAGERMRVPGAVEISAICTDPEFRGRGYAATLTATVAEALQADGLLPFLHVRHDNETAVAIYRWLGFRERLRYDAGVYQPPRG